MYLGITVLRALKTFLSEKTTHSLPRLEGEVSLGDSSGDRYECPPKAVEKRDLVGL
ncbi:hypothetical protein [Haladaptatus sp. DYSN1]|uniref:hypothetical protein n=1 Tax=unclassified Haladaptatus TaxID=2622732 RepID=UPI002405FF79|nr:hypothetical protein [Haladaptatus sp. DYSN1]